MELTSLGMLTMQQKDQDHSMCNRKRVDWVTAKLVEFDYWILALLFQLISYKDQHCLTGNQVQKSKLYRDVLEARSRSIS